MLFQFLHRALVMKNTRREIDQILQAATTGFDLRSWLLVLSANSITVTIQALFDP
jgi:hypothetical protein